MTAENLARILFFLSGGDCVRTGFLRMYLFDCSLEALPRAPIGRLYNEETCDEMAAGR
jgi:hypothetical protein